MPRKREFSVEEYYSRQTILKEFGKKGQATLKHSRVAIIGLGGLGTVSSLYLTLAGVGHMRLIDQDTVELANLHRQILYSHADLGYPKVEVAAKKLSRMNPTVKVEPVSENFNVDNAEKLFSSIDCVVDGLDNIHTRYVINRACAKLQVPYVFGAAIGIEGNLSVFAPPETPCLECVFPNVDNGSLLSCDVRGVLGATAGIIGTMQAMEAIKVLAELGSPLKGKLLICDFSDMYFATIDVFKRSSCAVCGSSIAVPGTREKLVWLCGRDTANINPEKPSKLSLSEVYEYIRRNFRVRLKSRLAIMFAYKTFEITLFNSGRMLVKNVKNERKALAVYKEVMGKLAK